MSRHDPHAAEVRRLAELLACAVRQKGTSRRALEEKLGMSRGDLSELLSGDADLRLSDLLRILEALEVHPWYFFRVAFSRPRTRAGAAGDSGAEEELVAVLQNARSPQAARTAELAESDGWVEEPPPTAEGNDGPDRARGARGSS